MTAETILRTEDLTKHFGEIRAVDGLALEVFRGDIYGLLGLNGAGKTTTIRMLMRLIAPTRGRILAFGEDIRAHQLDVLNRIGAMVEVPAFYPYLTGRKNLELLYGLSGGRDKARVAECLGIVGLAERGQHKVRTYSQGMRQRLGLAQALLTKPELVVLDEPTNGLDPQGIHDIRALIQRLNRDSGVTFVISSHLLYEIELTCNRVGIVHEGKLRVQDRVATLLASAKSVARVKAEPAETVRRVLADRKIEILSTDDGTCHIRCAPDDIADLAAALHDAHCRIHELAPGRVTLEDFFMAETGGNGGNTHAA